MDKKKLQFDFTEDAVEELDQLRQMTHLQTRVDVIRHALRFLRWAVDETTNGGNLCMERDGKLREVIPFWSSVTRPMTKTNGRNGR